jgi:DNA-binding XRE family transcriptional regulator
MTTDQFIAARRTLGYTRPEMAVALGLKGDHSVKTIERIEAGANITGPMALAVQKLLDDAA